LGKGWQTKLIANPIRVTTERIFIFLRGLSFVVNRPAADLKVLRRVTAHALVMSFPTIRASTASVARVAGYFPAINPAQLQQIANRRVPLAQGQFIFASFSGGKE
jgi:hypothetical protein